MLPILPVWARPGSDASTPTAEFQAGAGLALVGAALAAEAAHTGVWLDRLALRAAEVSLALAGRPEDEAAVRDAHHLTRPGHDPGPAGHVFGFWRRLAGRAPPTRPDDIETLARALVSRPGLGEAVRDVVAGAPSPLAAAAGIAAAVARVCPGYPALALGLADAALARRLGWPVTVPLLAAGLGGRSPKPEDPAWSSMVATAYARAAATACDRFGELGRRAGVLEAVKGRLRAKPAAAVVARLLAEDALSPARAAPGLSDRAGRRLCERLVALGAARELTGRSAFRLYGL